MSQIDQKTNPKIKVIRRSVIYIHPGISCLLSLPEEVEVLRRIHTNIIDLNQGQMDKILEYLKENGGKIGEQGLLSVPSNYWGYEIDEILGLTPITAGYAPHSCRCSYENEEEISSLQLL